MYTPRRTLFLCLLLCLPCCFVFAEGVVPSRLTIPGGPPDIYLTMPAKELLAQRKSIKNFSIFDDRPKDPVDPEIRRGTVSEDYKNAQFQHAFYFIEDAKLQGVVAFSEYQGKVPVAVRKKFLSNLVKTYGQPDSVIVVSNGAVKHQYNIPAMLWHFPTTIVLASITPDKIGSDAPAKSIVDIKLFALDYHYADGKSVDKTPYTVPQLTNAAREQILAPLLASLKKIPVSVKK